MDRKPVQAFEIGHWVALETLIMSQPEGKLAVSKNKIFENFEIFEILKILKKIPILKNFEIFDFF